MHRRNFIRFAGAGVVASGALASPLHQPSINQVRQTSLKKPDPERKALMKVGTQHSSSDEVLAILAALGVNHICSTLPSARLDEQWSVEALLKAKERVESFGIKLDMVPLPLSSSYITRAENPNIMLGKAPERDREIDA